MNVSQSLLLDGQSWAPALENFTNMQWQVGLIFGPAALVKKALPGLRSAFANVELMGCSTADEIHGLDVHTNSLVLTLIHFEKTPVRVISMPVSDGQSLTVGDSYSDIENSIQESWLMLCTDY